MHLAKSTTIGFLTLSIAVFGISSRLLANNESKNANLGAISDAVRHVSAVEAAQLIEQNADIKILDVRTASEFKRGHVKGAINLNYYSLGFKAALNELNKKTTWVVHCKSGVRSGRTVPIMKEAGFESIIHMDGGFDSWKEAGMPVN